MTKDKALKMAFEAMEYADACLKKQLTTKTKHEYAQDLLLGAGTAIKEALAQPAAQEPVAYCYVQKGTSVDILTFDDTPEDAVEGTLYPLYTAPHAAQPAPKTFEYWNAVEGWVKIEEVREHFETVGCGTIYKTAGEGRVPVYTTTQPAQESEPDERTHD